jgi:DNA-binding SARP family transcriptional activator
MARPDRLHKLAMEFRLLGNIEAHNDGRSVSIGYAQLRYVLAVLLVDANRIVSVDQLVDRVWGTRQWPSRPRAAVQHSISLLRTALADLPVTISWRAIGYELRVDPAAIDLYRFNALINQARAAADAARAAVLFEKALALWHGQPLAGLDTPWSNAVRAALVLHRDAVQLDLTHVRNASGGNRPTNR